VQFPEGNCTLTPFFLRDLGRASLPGALPRGPVQLLAKLLPRASVPRPVAPDLPAQREPRVGPGLRRHEKGDSRSEYDARSDTGTDQGYGAPVRLALERTAAWSGDGVRA
jgi:hypothetical protein